MKTEAVCIYPDSQEQADSLAAAWCGTHTVAVFPEPGRGIQPPDGCSFFRHRRRDGDCRAAAEASLRVAHPALRRVEHYPPPVVVDTSVRRVESYGNLEPCAGRDLAFVVVYFNACGYRRLRENMLDFLRAWRWMEGRLLVVELAFGDKPFELSGQAANLLQLRSDSVLWQKEALINVGCGVLRQRGFANVGWLDGDGDVACDGEDWYQQCRAALRGMRLVQAFEEIDLNFDDFSRRKLGAVAEYGRGEKSAWDCTTAGWGWAVRGEVWDACGWYDLGIAGSGDRLMFVGSLPGVDDLDRHAEMCGEGNRHLPVYAAWAKKWRAQVAGQGGYLSGVHVRCAPHGSSRDRAYRARADALVALGFDPARDVTRDENGLLAWTPQASDELKSYLAGYFANRREDG